MFHSERAEREEYFLRTVTAKQKSSNSNMNKNNTIHRNSENLSRWKNRRDKNESVKWNNASERQSEEKTGY